VTLRDAPPIILLDLNRDKLVFDEELSFNVKVEPNNLKLRGIIYRGQNHFTCRFIGRDGRVWFHDGIFTRSNCIPD
ncbi:hypothetical protein B0H19DRAFT_896463, partial [Mycena capillaripes]